MSELFTILLFHSVIYRNGLALKIFRIISWLISLVQHHYAIIVIYVAVLVLSFHH